MKIIHILISQLKSDRFRRINQNVFHLASQQLKRGKDVEVWRIGFEHIEPKIQDALKVPTTDFEKNNTPFLLDKNLVAKLKRLESRATVHLHGGWTMINYTLSTFLSNHKIPFVITSHGAYNNTALSKKYIYKRLYFQLFEKKMLHRAKNIHSVGESEVEGLSKLFPNNKTKLLPYGFNTQDNQIFGSVNHEKFIFGYLGRLNMYSKGLDYLIAAFNKIQLKYPDVELWIIGDGEDKRNLLQLLIDYNLISKVTFWGKLKGENRNRVMSKMSIVVQPSRNEELPFTVIEAASKGIPCVVSLATNLGGFINEYNAGLVIEDNNINALVSAMETMYQNWENRNLETFGNNAKNMVNDIFNWDNLIHEYDKLYKEH
jgi:glycosyltransferase involved in cell wall biosynthesis